MARGVVIPVAPDAAVERARGIIGRTIEPRIATALPRTIGYELHLYNGGRDPTAPHPGTWHPNRRRFTCDCAGFVCWALGFDRYQPNLFPRVWINTDSILADAAAHRSWFEPLTAPEPGCLVVYGRNAQAGKPGHVGIVSYVPAAPNWDTLRVVHCSHGNEKRSDAAVQETSAAIWDRPGARFVRYRRP